MVLLKKKKITRDYNWLRSLGNKKNQKGKCQRGERAGFCRVPFCHDLHAWAALINHLIFEEVGACFVLCPVLDLREMT